MRFTVLRATGRRLNRVTSINAGDSQTVICAPFVYLQGYIDDDPSKHTIEWVQLTGISVTLMDSNTLTPWFETISGDYVFRLYVDRNTPFEVYDDVFVSGTPSSYTESLIYQRSFNFHSQQYNVATVTSVEPYLSPNDKNQWLDNQPNNMTFVENFSGSVFMEVWNGNGWNGVGFLSTPNLFLEIPNNSLCRLTFIYTEPTSQSQKTIMSQPLNFSNEFLRKAQSVSSFESVSVRKNTWSVSSTFLTRIEQDIDDTLTANVSGFRDSWTSSTVFFTKVTIDDPANDDKFSLLSGFRSHLTITRLFGSSIGN